MNNKYAQIIIKQLEADVNNSIRHYELGVITLHELVKKLNEIDYKIALLINY